MVTIADLLLVILTQVSIRKYWSNVILIKSKSRLFSKEKTLTAIVTLLLLQSELSSNSDLTYLLKSIYLLVWVLSFLFVLCEMADNVTEQYERTNIYEHSDWYNFPNDIKRFLPIIIHNTQTSVVVKGFGNIDCTREEFKKVSFS